MSFFAGFDASGFPGLNTMAWLRANTNLVWCGFYLGSAPSHPDPGWMPHRQSLEDQGWGLAPIYVGQQIIGPGGHLETANQGTLDGLDAARLMEEAGFPRGCGVWLDLENGLPLTSPESGYVKAWAASVLAWGYNPKVYCSHYMAPAVAALDAVDPDDIWVFKVVTTVAHDAQEPYPATDPAGSGWPQAQMWQLEQNARIGAGAMRLLVDLSSATSANPCAAVSA